MIAYLQGTIRKKFDRSLILDTGNVGYLVHVPTRLAEKMEENGPSELFIFTKVREDDISLYGFETIGELDFFKTLLGINGIGPKLGLEVMSQNIEKVKNAIIAKDIAFLSKIPGIGKKTAERIVVELKNKLDWDLTSPVHAGLEKKTDNDTVNALMGLGYQKFEINRVLKEMPENITEVEEVVTYFLRNV
jgi:Holliday junction DNA helicase RuvA